eukprot:TRINITY_DN8296_c0_g2_i1.p1 TRINITY_DN8296_c0_g2~~TRINITY_DN8296_c0_g2_i1.p1  ORF type:complete len:341 (+),score=117.49 TRINITY_DN8296_c0_g2_i1:88-1023(+)
MAADPRRQGWLFEFAPPAYTIRSAEKDAHYKRDLTEHLNETVTRIVGTRAANRLEQELRLVAAGLYFFLSMGNSRQTLGQEYSDVIQVHESRLRPLQTGARIAQAFVHIGVPYLLDRWLPVLMGFLRNRADQLRPQWLRSLVLRAHGKQLLLKGAVHQALRLHLALFFINGRFYHISERATRARLLLMTKPRPAMSYAWIGYIIIAQQVIELIQWIRAGGLSAGSSAEGAHDTAGESDEDEGLSAEVGSCALCLGARDGRKGPTTATVCGHLYCWDCISDLCRKSSSPQCPLCRERISLQTLAPIYRYKPS